MPVTMPKFPITGDVWTDCVIVAVLVIFGTIVFLKGGSKWGIVFIAVAIGWAYEIMSMVK